MDAIGIIVVTAAGTGIGLLHFGALWWTLDYAVRGPHAAAVCTLSYLARMAATVGAFYLVMDGDWKRLVALTAGFTVARFGLAARLGSGAPAKAGTGNAS